MDSNLADNDVFEDFSDLVRDIINEMGYNVEEQQLREIEKNLRLLEENADVADPKLFSCLLDNFSDLSLFISDPEQSLQQLALKVDTAGQKHCSPQTQEKIPQEFDQLIIHGYERLQEVYEDIKRYERLELDNKENGQQNSANANAISENDYAGRSEDSLQNQSRVADQKRKDLPSTTLKTMKWKEKENRRPLATFGRMKPRAETHLLNQFLKSNAMRRTMCPEPGRLPFKHDKQLKLEQYRREWAKNPPPGEQKRMALRWRIRELMMKREIPQLRIVTTDGFPEDGTIFADDI